MEDARSVVSITRRSEFNDAGAGELLPFTEVGTARPETWGPPMWDSMIHILNAVGSPTRESFEDGPSQVIFTLTQEELEDLMTRLESFSHLIPCPKCAGHFRDALSRIDRASAAMRTRAGWLDWVTRQKDTVNRLSGKSTHTASERARFVRDIIILTPPELCAARSRENSRARADAGGGREEQQKKKKAREGIHVKQAPSCALHLIFFIVVILAIFLITAVCAYHIYRSKTPGNHVTSSGRTRHNP